MIMFTTFCFWVILGVIAFICAGHAEKPIYDRIGFTCFALWSLPLLPLIAMYSLAQRLFTKED